MCFLGIKVINFSSLIRLVESSGYGWGCMEAPSSIPNEELGCLLWRYGKIGVQTAGREGQRETKEQGEGKDHLGIF